MTLTEAWAMFVEDVVKKNEEILVSEPHDLYFEWINENENRTRIEAICWCKKKSLGNLFGGTPIIKKLNCNTVKEMSDKLKENPAGLSKLLSIFNESAAVPHLESRDQSIKSRRNPFFPFCGFGKPSFSRVRTNQWLFPSRHVHVSLWNVRSEEMKRHVFEINLIGGVN